MNGAMASFIRCMAGVIRGGRYAEMKNFVNREQIIGLAIVRKIPATVEGMPPTCSKAALSR